MRDREVRLSPEEKKLLILLKAAMTGNTKILNGLSLTEGIPALAEDHAVLPLLYDPVCSLTEGKGSFYERVCFSARQTVLQSYHLLILSRQICDCLEKAGIQTAVLKGAAAASFYPVPEYRKSGDIDILLCDPEKKETAIQVLQEAGFQMDPVQPALHQIVLKEKNGVEVELHIMLAEPFDNRRVNRCMETAHSDIRKHIIRKRIMGVELPILDDDYQAFELLLHMLQHFLRRGFGLKLLCDWTAYWNNRVRKGRVSVRRYKELIRSCGITGFSDMITAVCCRYLGMNRELSGVLLSGKKGMPVGRAVRESFLREVFDGGEFGDLEKNRMVMLRGRGLGDYFREFHHQMHLNFPKAGEIPVFWPGLWGATLGKFLYNNVKIRHTTSYRILKKSEERSRILRSIRLWER